MRSVTIIFCGGGWVLPLLGRQAGDPTGWMLRFNTAIHHTTTFHYICSFPRNVVASQCIIIRFVLCREQNQNHNYSSLDLSSHTSFQLDRSGQTKGLNNDDTIESICRNQIHFCMQMQKLRSYMEEEVDRNQKKT